MRHRFRLPNPHRVHGDFTWRCSCDARPDQAPSASSFAGHVLGCTQCSKGLGINNPLLTRHNLPLPVPVLNDLYAHLYAQMGFQFGIRPAFLRVQSQALVTTSSSTPVLVPNLP